MKLGGEKRIRSGTFLATFLASFLPSSYRLIPAADRSRTLPSSSRVPLTLLMLMMVLPLLLLLVLLLVLLVLEEEEEEESRQRHIDAYVRRRTENALSRSSIF